jgi:hypothetical protein
VLAWPGLMGWCGRALPTSSWRPIRLEVLSVMCAPHPVATMQLTTVQRLMQVKETVACLVRDKIFIPALDAVDDAEAVVSRDLQGLAAVTWVPFSCCPSPTPGVSSAAARGLSVQCAPEFCVWMCECPSQCTLCYVSCSPLISCCACFPGPLVGLMCRRRHLLKDLTRQRAVIGETMTHQFVTIAVRVLSVGVLESDSSNPGASTSSVDVMGAVIGEGHGDAARRDQDALAAMLDVSLRPLVEGLTRVREPGWSVDIVG